MAQHHIIFFGLSTCIHCRHTKEFLDRHDITYNIVWVDKLQGSEREQAIETIQKYNPQLSFPTLIIDEGKDVVVGFQRETLIRDLELDQKDRPIAQGEEASDQVRKLYGQLQAIQEPKGYYLNKDQSMTMQLLQQLLVTKERYGYMACPCRMANGRYEEDKDIICPCVYRTPDVEEYSCCFCGLYVSKAWNEGDIAPVYVPDRRPPTKIIR